MKAKDPAKTTDASAKWGDGSGDKNTLTAVIKHEEAC